jgi:diguanylate cyclase (GGDEF)-like protein
LIIVAPLKAVVSTPTGWEQSNGTPTPEDGLVLLGHSLVEETGAAGVLIAAETEQRDVLYVNAGASLEFLIAEQDGVMASALRASTLATQRMPAPTDSGFSDLALGAIRSPAGRRGAICLAFTNGRFTEPESLSWTLDTYARLGGICLDNGGGFQRLVAAATLDALTGCVNYSGLRFTLDAEIERATRYGLKLSICFMDLDAFKRLNDDEGHEAGNRVLAEVGEILLAQARTTDTVARYGGDEFVVMLPETSLRSAVRLAKRLRGALATATTPAGRSLGVSAGVAQWRVGLSAEALLTEADGALRRAKEDGSGVATAR